MKLGVTLDVLNQRATPAFYADTLANRPAAGFAGRVFISTDTFDLYRDNGSTWDLLSPANAGTITGSGAAGQVAYFDAASNITGTNNLFWDSTNNRLGINTNTAGAALDIHSTQSTILQLNQISLNDTRIAFQLSGSALWRLGNYYNGGANDFELFDVIAAQAPITIKKTTGQVLIGTNIVGSGKLVVASAFGDNGVQIVGATSPSLRIDNAASGATKRAGLGIATNTNNFIQGSADRDFCIFNGSTTAASPMLFGIYDAGLTNVQEAARISAARNFLVGTSVDAGFKADINGTARIQNEITVNGTGTNTIDRITITRAGSDSQINGLGGGFMRLNAPRINIVQGLIVSNSFGTGTGTMVIRSGVDNPSITEMQFASTNASTILARFFSNTGNFGINQTTDAGYKLDVNGTARISNSSFSGAGLQFAHTANLTSVITGGTGGENITFGPSNRIFLNASQINANYLNGVQTIASPSNTATTIITNVNATNSGPVSGVSITGTQTIQSSGFDGVLTIAPNINASGGTTNAIVVGLYYNPTLTSLTGTTHRAIQTISGDVCLGTTSGNVLIGTATSGASKLRIVGLPTSAVGLSSGDIYSNAGILTIVP